MKRSAVVAAALIIIGVALRLVPHTANFAPVGAIALFGGAVLSTKVGWWLPVVVMAISDIFLGLHDTILFTWGSFMLIALLGMSMRNKSDWFRVPAGAIGSAIIFFVISNFGVWVEGRLYPHTIQGLIDCYVAAIPFLKTSFLADLFYGMALFGSYALATRDKKTVLVDAKEAS